MRILVCGSRTWYTCVAEIEAALRPYTGEQPDAVVIHGGASGVDTVAGNVAYRMGFQTKIYPANWALYGKSAGYIRNKQMLDEGKPDIVLAFWDGKSRGTKMMIELAQKAGVPVKIYLLEGKEE